MNRTCSDGRSPANASANRSRPRVDDLPWLDRASAVGLGFAARRLGGGDRAGFLGAYRSEDGGFFDRGGVTTHHLRPLDPVAAEELLRERFPALTPRLRARLLSEARGNPLALLELPIALAGTRHAATAIPDVLPLGRRLQTLFTARIEALPPTTRLLLLCAVLDGTGDLHTLQAATATTTTRAGTGTGTGPTGVEDLAHAERAGLVYVNDTTGRLTFRHPLTRSAVVELSTSDQRRRIHRALAEHPAPDRWPFERARVRLAYGEHLRPPLGRPRRGRTPGDR
ncbi:hypothetical protein [Streptomyces sp. NPDC020817]|uniref:hypothetical protein n=1 Tax=Streptomyces sp. NPDC020817 TaxID=3365095 RepID=UPI00378D1A3E